MMMLIVVMLKVMVVIIQQTYSHIHPPHPQHQPHMQAGAIIVCRRWPCDCIAVCTKIVPACKSSFEISWGTCFVHPLIFAKAVKLSCNQELRPCHMLACAIIVCRRRLYSSVHKDCPSMAPAYTLTRVTSSTSVTDRIVTITETASDHHHNQH